MRFIPATTENKGRRGHTAPSSGDPTAVLEHRWASCHQLSVLHWTRILAPHWLLEMGPLLPPGSLGDHHSALLHVRLFPMRK